MQCYSESTERHVPPVNLYLVNMPSFHYTWIHFGMAQLSEAFFKEMVIDTDDLLKITTIICMAHQRLSDYTFNCSHLHCPTPILSDSQSISYNLSSSL